VILNNSTSINIMNSHFSPQIIFVFFLLKQSMINSVLCSFFVVGVLKIYKFILPIERLNRYITVIGKWFNSVHKWIIFGGVKLKIIHWMYTRKCNKDVYVLDVYNLYVLYINLDVPISLTTKKGFVTTCIQHFFIVYVVCLCCLFVLFSFKKNRQYQGMMIKNSKFI
jgi:hypothetical protein